MTLCRSVLAVACFALLGGTSPGASIASAQGTFWDEALDHRPDRVDGSVRTDEQPTGTDRHAHRIHRGSATEEILVAIQPLESSVVHWILALQRLRDEDRLAERDALIDDCIASDRRHEVRETCAFYRANDLARDGRFQRAADTLRPFVTFQHLTDIRVAMMLNLAEIYAALGEEQSSRSLYERILTERAPDPDASLGLALLHLKRGDFAGARVLARDSERAREFSTAPVEDGIDRFYVPRGDAQLISLLNASLTGDRERLDATLEDWRETPSFSHDSNRGLARQITAFREEAGTRVSKVTLPPRCLPEFATQDRSGRRTLIACVDLRTLEVDDSGNVADLTALIQTDDFNVQAADEQIVDARYFARGSGLEVLTRNGRRLIMTLIGGEWRVQEVHAHQLVDVRAVQIVDDVHLLFMSNHSNGYAVVSQDEQPEASRLQSLTANSSVTDMVVSPASGIGLAISSQHTVLFDLEANRVLHAFIESYDRQSTSADMTGDGAHVAIFREKGVTVFETSTGEALDYWYFPSAIGNIGVEWVDGTRSFVVSATNEVYRVNF